MFSVQMVCHKRGRVLPSVSPADGSLESCRTTQQGHSQRSKSHSWNLQDRRRRRSYLAPAWLSVWLVAGLVSPSSGSFPVAGVALICGAERERGGGGRVNPTGFEEGGETPARFNLLSLHDLTPTAAPRVPDRPPACVRHAGRLRVQHQQTKSPQL